MESIERIRQSQFEIYIPTIWMHKRYLYVGANLERFHFRLGLAMAYDMRGAIIDIYEIEKERGREVQEKNPWINHLYVGDVAGEGVPRVQMNYNVAIWSHGPAILDEVNKIDQAISNLLAVAELVIIMTPWGEYPYPKGVAETMNPNDVAKLSLGPQFFIRRGFAVQCIGYENKRGSNLLAWKYAQHNPKPWRTMPCEEEDFMHLPPCRERQRQSSPPASSSG
jgi:hypothetical protein